MGILLEIYNNELSLIREKKKVKKEKKAYNKNKEEEDIILYDDSIYDILNRGTYKLTQISKGVRKNVQGDSVEYYNPDDGSDRSLFNKKANRVTIDGYRYGFTSREIRDIRRQISKANR